jgi:ubiquitin-protein ligase
MEMKLLARYMSDFHFYDPRRATYVEGPVQTSDGRRYRIRVPIPPEYPFQEPGMYVIEPAVLRRRTGDTVNSLGGTHSFHTKPNGPDGCVQICHTRDWDASVTLLKVVLKGVVWLEAYAAHLRTGRPIADFLAA